MKKMMVALPLVALVAACGGSGSNGGNAAAQLKIVGSSTVYPFTTAIAETFQRANPGSSVIVESTGTGAGIKLFCEGVGGQTPDMVNASRQMKASEYEDCSQNGAKNVIEVAVGIDGLTLIQAKEQPALHYLYRALDTLSAGLDKEALRKRLHAARDKAPEVLASVTTPTLWITGEEDLVFPSFIAPGLAARMPNGRHVSVPRAGHSAYFERPAVFNEAVGAFLDAVGSP